MPAPPHQAAPPQHQAQGGVDAANQAVGSGQLDLVNANNNNNNAAASWFDNFGGGDGGWGEDAGGCVLRLGNPL